MTGTPAVALVLVVCVSHMQLEAVPIGKQIKKLRQHTNPDVQQQAVRVLAKMRQDVKSACDRAAKAKPIVAKLSGAKKATSLQE